MAAGAEITRKKCLPELALEGEFTDLGLGAGSHLVNAPTRSRHVAQVPDHSVGVLRAHRRPDLVLSKDLRSFVEAAGAKAKRTQASVQLFGG